MTTLMLLTILPVQARATSETPPILTAPAPSIAEARAVVLLDRLDEIKSMDKSAMGRIDKKDLRNEVRAIKSELKSSGGGVYLSVGAIVIILLLLILLL
jgi:hypothetical protein